MRKLVERLLLTSRLALVGVVATVAVGCSSFSGPKYPLAPATAATADYNYIVGPGDSLNIIVWRNPELSMMVPVRPDGKLTTPLVDELLVQGKTSVEIARDVEKVLSKFVRDPIVTVIVTGFVGPYSEQIRVVGEAAKPQFLPYKQKMTLLDVMIAVGGLTDFADGNAASILRASEGGKQYSVRIKDLVRRGDISANVEMRPGDVLIIPQGWF
jgi:polysaccharide biosynthesis/export protein